jgi:hypothetical protein
VNEPGRGGETREVEAHLDRSRAKQRRVAFVIGAVIGAIVLFVLVLRIIGWIRALRAHALPLAAALPSALALALAGGCSGRLPDAAARPRAIESTDCSASAGVPCREVTTPMHACPEGVMDLFTAEVRLVDPDAVEVTGAALQSYGAPMAELDVVVRAPHGGIITVITPFLTVTSGGAVFDTQVGLDGRGLGEVDFYLFFTCDDLVWEMDFPAA